jgi:putative redox protein
MTEVIVSSVAADSLQQTVRCGRHHLLADEPLAAGGDDAGPAPFDFLLAALGSCTAMTLRLYANRKALPLQQIEVKLVIEEREIDGRRQQAIRRDIVLQGELTEEQRQRLLAIAEKCPVHKALQQAMPIISALIA